jgi:dDENN domain
MKESFLASVDESHVAFFGELVETQAFYQYSDKRVRKVDKGSRHPSGAVPQVTL